MSLWSVVFLSLTHLGVGMAFTLLLVSSQAGVKFFRFNAGLAAVLLAIGAAFHPPEASALGAAGQVSQCGLAVAVAALVIYWVTVGRGLRVIRPVLLPAALAGGAAAIVAQALAVSASRARSAVADDRQLPGVGRPARRRLHRDDPRALVSRAAVAGRVAPPVDGEVPHRLDDRATVTVVVTASSSCSCGIPATRMFRRYVFTSAGIFFWQRVLFGPGRTGSCCRI